MNTSFMKQVSLLSGLAALTFVATSVSAQGATVETVVESGTESGIATELTANADMGPEVLAEAGSPTTVPLTYSTSPTILVADAASVSEAVNVTDSEPLVASVEELRVDAASEVTATSESAPAKEAIALDATPTELPAVSTSAAALMAQAQPPATQSPVPGAEEFPSPEEVVPTEVEPGITTRAGTNYIGVAGNLGIVGDSALGDNNFSVISKIGLTRFLSVRPAAVIDFDDDATILLPVTLDFFPRQPGEVTEDLGISIAPYVGGGAAFSTDGDIGPMLTGGFDIPISPQFTANAAVNVGFLDPVDIGVRVGIGYNFPGLF